MKMVGIPRRYKNTKYKPWTGFNFLHRKKGPRTGIRETLLLLETGFHTKTEKENSKENEEVYVHIRCHTAIFR